MEFQDVIVRRKSTRKFTDEPVAQEQLDAILLAANAAPVGSARYGNIQLSVVKSKELMEKLATATQRLVQDRMKMKAITGNSAPAATKKIDPFYGAPVVIVVSHKMHDVQPGIEYANVACVCENMHLTATNLGLGSFYTWGVWEAMRLYPELDTSSVLDLPEDYTPIMGLVVGHPQALLEPREIRERIPVKFFE